jgi:K+/H+ antiporter YhaU regulatory subunit KhtT
LIPAKENDAFLQGLDDGLEDEEDDDEEEMLQQHRQRFGEHSVMSDIMGKGKTKDEDEEKLDAVVRDLGNQKLKEDESKFLDADE